jgi:hypothetical protein
MEKTYRSLKEFYPFYLSEHSNINCRRLHFLGTTLVFIFFGIFLYTFNFWYFLMIPISGYGFAWIGHFFFEKNKPATFQYPLYSFCSDFIMYWDILKGNVKI